MWREVIELGNLVEQIEFGEIVKEFVFRKVYANKKSVRQSEFYQGATAGLRPELVFEVRSVEFDNEEVVRHNEKDYTIIRTFENGEIIELTVTSHTGSEV